MSVKLSPPITTLNEWLYIAIGGLCVESQSRIDREIRAHVGEHAEHLQQEGLSEEAAVAKAVEALGNPRKARRAFRRSHLTAKEMKYFQSIPSEKNKFDIYAIPLYCLVLWVLGSAFLLRFVFPRILVQDFFAHYWLIWISSGLLLAAWVAYAVEQMPPIMDYVIRSWFSCAYFLTMAIYLRFGPAGLGLLPIFLLIGACLNFARAIRTTRLAIKLKIIKFPSQPPTPPEGA